MDRDQARHAGAALVFRAHRVARPLGRDHQHVEVGARLDQVEMHVEAVREHQRRTVLHVGGEVIAIDVGLQLVGRQHHHHVGPLGGLGDLHDLELLALGLGHALGALAQRDRDVLDARVAQVERVGVPLAAIADDGDLLALDQVQVGVAIVVNAHGVPLPCFGQASRTARHGRQARWYPASGHHGYDARDQQYGHGNVEYSRMGRISEQAAQPHSECGPGQRRRRECTIANTSSITAKSCRSWPGRT